LHNIQNKIKILLRIHGLKANGIGYWYRKSPHLPAIARI